MRIDNSYAGSPGHYSRHMGAGFVECGLPIVNSHHCRSGGAFICQVVIVRWYAVTFATYKKITLPEPESTS